MESRERQRPQRATHNELQIIAELALVGVTAAAVIGLDNLFEDGSFRGPLLFQVVLAHACLAAVRRTNLKLLMSTAVVVTAGVLAISWSQYAETLWVLLPSTDTWDVIWADVNHAQVVFDGDRPPAPVEPGFIVAISPIIWLIAAISDWAAFRVKLSFEAVLPSVAAFLFAAVLSSREEGLGWGAPVYAGACLGFLLLHRTWGQESTSTWASFYRRRARRTLLGTGSVLTAVAVVIGAALGPNLPGVDAQPVYAPWQPDAGGDETRVVVSPLVDIRGRLVNTSDVEVFTVQSSGGGSYWRTTALDTFDGEIWGSSYNTDEVGGTLPQATAAETDTETMTQEVSIQQLAEIWLPAAYEPTAFDAGVTPVLYDEESSSLLVEEASDSSDGLSYVVESEVPRWTDDQLRQAPEELPSGIADRYLELPDDLDNRVQQEALRITEGVDTSYDKAIALQDHLRTFDYTLDVDIRHDEDALVQFLFEDQQGYCEQFAGTFAAMARSLGIPTRVAIGFTQGEEDPYEEGLFRVKGEHAHAWPEVYFEGYGWVPFEPTPGRGPSNAEDWLGVSEQQAGQEAEDPPEPDEPDATSPQPSAGEEGGTGSDDGPNQAEAAPTPSSDGEEGLIAADTDESDWYHRLVEPALRIALVLAACQLVIPSALALQRYRRRRRARQPYQQVQLAWEETFEQAATLGLLASPSMTLNERAALLQADLPTVSPAIRTMTTVLERNLYAGTAPDPADATAVREAADEVQAELARRRSWQSRLRYHLDARRLLPNRPGSHRRSAHGAERSHS